MHIGPELLAHLSACAACRKRVQVYEDSTMERKLLAPAPEPLIPAYAAVNPTTLHIARKVCRSVPTPPREAT